MADQLFTKGPQGANSRSTIGMIKANTRPVVSDTYTVSDDETVARWVRVFFEIVSFQWQEWSRIQGCEHLLKVPPNVDKQQPLVGIRIGIHRLLPFEHCPEGNCGKNELMVYTSASTVEPEAVRERVRQRAYSTRTEYGNDPRIV